MIKGDKNAGKRISNKKRNYYKKIKEIY